MIYDLIVSGKEDRLAVPYENATFSYRLQDERTGARQTALFVLLTDESGAEICRETRISDMQSTQPLPPLSPETEYTLEIAATVTDSAGNEQTYRQKTNFLTQPDYAALPAKWIVNEQDPAVLSPAHVGFFSREFDSETAQPQITLDFGEEVSPDYVVVTGARPFDVPCQPDCPGLYFPLAFTIEGANLADFSDAQCIYRSPDPVPNPGNQRTFYEVNSPFRYLKFTANRLQRVSETGFRFALEQIEVLRGLDNLAPGAKVMLLPADAAAQDSSTNQLIDGCTVWHTEGRAIPMRQPAFFRAFTVEKPVRRAVLYLSALGLYEAELGGKRVGDRFLCPGWTEYAVYANADAYDVTPLIGKHNLLMVQAADGWYAGRVGMANVFGKRKLRGVYGDRPKIYACLSLFYEDGTTEKICSDASFLTTANTAVLKSDLYDGETYDSSRTLKTAAFYESGGNLSALPYAKELVPAAVTEESVRLSSRFSSSVFAVEEVPYAAKYTDKNGRAVLDFGKNFAGTVKYTFYAKRGDVVRFLYAEHKNADNTCYFANYRGAQPVDEYLAATDGLQEFFPRFTYRGFRYVTVLGLNEANLISATGVALSSAKTRTGNFAFSAKAANRLTDMIAGTLRSNLVGVQTDCCERDERLSWCMDGFDDGKYFYDLCDFFRRNQYEREVAPVPENMRPDQTPNALSMFTGQSLLDSKQPYLFWQLAGEKEDLVALYERNRTDLSSFEERFPGGIVEVAGYVDWLNGDMIDAEGYPKTGGQISTAEYQTLQQLKQLDLFLKTADVLKKTDDIAHFTARKQTVKNAFRQHLMTEDLKTKSDTQTSYAMAIAHGIYEKEELPLAAKHYLAAVKRYGGRLSCGVYVIDDVLSSWHALGMPDVALSLAFQSRFPSFGYMMATGATTLWERWDSYIDTRPDPQIKLRWQAAPGSHYTFVNAAGSAGVSMNSFNHLEMSSSSKWLIERVAGLKLSHAPAQAEFTLTQLLSSLIRQAEGSLLTARGKLEFVWLRETAENSGADGYAENLPESAPDFDAAALAASNFDDISVQKLLNQERDLAAVSRLMVRLTVPVGTTVTVLLPKGRILLDGMPLTGGASDDSVQEGIALPRIKVRVPAGKHELVRLP